MDVVEAPGTAPGAASGPSAWVSVWGSALDDLELDVARAEALLSRDAQPVTSAWEAAAAVGQWEPPVLPGPLPASLQARARSLLSRQLRVSDELVRAMADSGRLRRLSERLDPQADERMPVFLDSRS